MVICDGNQSITGGTRQTFPYHDMATKLLVAWLCCWPLTGEYTDPHQTWLTGISLTHRYCFNNCRFLRCFCLDEVIINWDNSTRFDCFCHSNYVIPICKCWTSGNMCVPFIYCKLKQGKAYLIIYCPVISFMCLYCWICHHCRWARYATAWIW